MNTLSAYLDPYTVQTQRRRPYTGSRSYVFARRTSLRRSMPAWGRAAHFDKLAEAYCYLDRVGGITFTLRLGLDALICVTGSADPARDMSRRFQRAFARAGIPMPLLAFCLEVTPDEHNVLHLHGAIAPGENSRDKIIEILRGAGGMILGRAGSRQVKLKPFDHNVGGPLGWANYTKLGAVRTRRELDTDKIIYISRDLVQCARERWETRRAQQRRCSAPKPSRFY